VAKFAPDLQMDAGLDYIAQANILHLCSAQPTTYAGIAAVSLGSIAYTPVTDFTKAAGAASGSRQVTVTAKSGLSVGTSGTATHFVLAKTTDTTLRWVTTCTSQAVTSGNTVNVSSFIVQINQPT
jgi:hypothetical protein